MSTYELPTTCTNCGESERMKIPKGMHVFDCKCSNCGCYTIRKDIDPVDYKKLLNKS